MEQCIEEATGGDIDGDEEIIQDIEEEEEATEGEDTMKHRKRSYRMSF